ncbi:AAA family ATPase [Metabacillus fastidiosus]|uniref:nucleotide-binding protein n=1 Tax=Metabacillus fastidiosus TaxID=1458 RepID=UPI003D2DBEB9
MKISFYGKSGIGKTTIVSNLAVGLAKRGFKVLQIGVDPKRDSHLSIVKKFIPTVVEVIEAKSQKNEDFSIEDFIYEGYQGVHCIEAGAPPAGIGCGGFVTGETIKILKQFDRLDYYDYYLYDVPGDLICGGYTAPLQYSDLSYVIAGDDFNSIYSVNRLLEGIKEKSKGYDIKIAGVIVNNHNQKERISKYCEELNLPIISEIDEVHALKTETLKTTIYEANESLNVFEKEVQQFEKIVDAIIAQSHETATLNNPDPLSFEDLIKSYRKLTFVEA